MKALRILFHTLGATFSLALSTAIAMLLCTALALTLWVQSDASLPRAMGLAARLLPAGQILQATDVTGSLQRGGHFGSVHWKSGDLSISAQDLTLAWDWHALLDGTWHITTLKAAALVLDDRRAASAEPFAEMVLPFKVDAPFEVERLEWSGPATVQLQKVRGHYLFDGRTHVLEGGQLQLAAGTYAVAGQLQAQLPGTLALRASGTVQAPLASAGVTSRTVTLLASASAKGTLYGKSAAIDVLLDLQPVGSGASRPLGAMQAHAQAHLLPSEVQPIARASAQWKQLDLASVWPQAPQTSLSGEASVVPDGPGWKGELQVLNALDGPLTQQRVPLRSATASLLYRDTRWQLSHLQAALAGGTVQAQGTFAGNPAQWSVQGDLHGVDPALINPKWAIPPLDGEVTARQTAAGFDFETHLAGVRAGQGRAELQAKGAWNAPALVLHSLQLQTPQAHLTGQLQLDTRTYAAKGDLVATMPGAQARLAGQASPVTGQGSTEWHVSDADVLVGWLAGLPVVGDSVKGLSAQGALDLSATWRGGWQNLGADLQVDATLQSLRLEVQGTPLSDVHLAAKGSLQALALQLQGKVQTGPAQVTLQSQSVLSQTRAGQWHARVSQLQATVLDGLQPSAWKLAISRPLEVDFQNSVQVRSVQLGAGSMQLSGPAPGEALLQWQAASWSQPGATPSAPGQSRWNTRGTLQGVPLAWLEVLGQTRIANLGLRGDLVFGGQWDANGGDGLQLRAGLQRSSGDLQLLAADSVTAALPAGLRDAHIDLQVARDTVRAKLVWASDAGGNAQADFSTRLAADGRYRLAPDAPLQGSVQASLPRVGAWSMFAPVGWRIHGTLDASATLSGTLANPAWTGSVSAQDMAVRSVVDGLDFSGGVMRLKIDGQHMDIAEFMLQGAGGAAGGQVTATGAVDWLPGAPGVPLAKRLRMAVDAQAKAFRVTARPDQRLVVSGNLSARLVEAKLSVRGALVADQALFILPEDSTPKLGADVVVKRNKSGAKAPAPPVEDPPSRLLSTVAPDVSVTLDPGSNFQLQGHGLTTRLAGQVTLKTAGNSPEPRLLGELRTVDGAYRAYGQRLSIEEGTLRFTGAFDNPSLDIRAIRPNLQQVVGVQVSGTAQLPVVRLYSEPDMSEIEKLSWLVLGRSSANGGAQTAILQQAAVSLLTRNGRLNPTDQLFTALGLDEVSLGQAATTNLDGTAGTEATVKFGKRLSRDFYVAYERTLAGTMGTLYVFYDLSKRFTLRGESGTSTAIDLIFTTRYD